MKNLSAVSSAAYTGITQRLRFGQNSGDAHQQLSRHWAAHSCINLQLELAFELVEALEKQAFNLRQHFMQA